VARYVEALKRGEFDYVDDLAGRAATFRWTYDDRPLKVA
jgi:hypothetical protein